MPNNGDESGTYPERSVLNWLVYHSSLLLISDLAFTGVGSDLGRGLS